MGIVICSSLPSLEDEEIYQEHVKLFPVGRFGTSEDVAAAVSFLASEEFVERQHFCHLRQH